MYLFIKYTYIFYHIVNLNFELRLGVRDDTKLLFGVRDKQEAKNTVGTQ